MANINSCCTFLYFSDRRAEEETVAGDFLSLAGTELRTIVKTSEMRASTLQMVQTTEHAMHIVYS